jgi:hypothetical protein
MKKQDTPTTDGEHESEDSRWIALRPSRLQRVAVLLMAIVGVTLAVMVMLSEHTWLPLAWRVALVVAPLVGFAWVVWRWFTPANAVVAFQLVELDGVSRDDPKRAGIRVRRIDSQTTSSDLREDEGVLVTPAFVTPWLTTIRFQADVRDRGTNSAWGMLRRWCMPHAEVVAIWPDAIDPDDFRRVRVALKWQPVPV